MDNKQPTQQASKHTPLDEDAIEADVKRWRGFHEYADSDGLIHEDHLHDACDRINELSTELRRTRRLLEDIQAENVKVTQRTQRMRDYAHGAYWCWQGDGEDHPESLACPVLMSADDLRSLLAERRLLEAGQRLADAAENYIAIPGINSRSDLVAEVSAYQEAAKPQEREGD